MERISNDTMWFIVEQQRQSFLDNCESEVSHWIQERLEEQDWETLEDIIEEDFYWEHVITKVLYKLVGKDGERFSELLYHNLQIQHRSDRQWMCEMIIKRVKEAIIHE